MHDRYFLHIGKTGGSAIKAAIRPYAEDRSIFLGRHGLTLVGVPQGKQALFCVRDPCQRFVSGFNSRKRKGLPRYEVDWNEDEAWAFARFATPNALAESLSSANGTTRADAERAMNGISHTGLRLSFWLLSANYLRRRQSDILWIGHLPSLFEDFAVLRTMLDLPADTVLPTDEIGAHRTPPGYETELSATGAANIASWYRKDVDLYALCLEMRDKLLGG